MWSYVDLTKKMRPWDKKIFSPWDKISFEMTINTQYNNNQPT